MKNKKTLSNVFVILSIATFIICLLLNFIEFQNGGAASLRSVIITLSYVTVWILVLVTGLISKNRGAMKYCAIFWFITFITSVTALHGNMVDTVGNWVDLIFPLMLFFMGQWYGLRFFIRNNIAHFTIIAVISLVMLAIGVIWLIYNKNELD